MTSSNILKDAEEAAYNYIQTIYEAANGRNIFKGAAPVGSFNTIDFGFVGAPRSALARSTGGVVSVNSWVLDARVRGVFDTRDKTIQAMGILMVKLPAGQLQKSQDAARDIKYIQTMRLDTWDLGSGWVTSTQSRREQLVGNFEATLEVVICTSP